MVSLTLSVPKEMKEEMDRHPELNWSEVARQAIWKKIILLKKMDNILEKSKLTEEDALKIGKSVNENLAKRYKEMM